MSCCALEAVCSIGNYTNYRKEACLWTLFQIKDMAEGYKRKHLHYVYCLRYNNVYSKVIEYNKCPKKGIFHFDRHCIEIVQTKNISKRASNLRKESLSRLYLLKDFFPEMGEGGLKEYKDRYVEERDINMALSKHVIPQIVVEQCHDNLELSLFKNIKDNKICMEVADVKVAVAQCKKDLLTQTRSVEEELPLNRWLYEYIYTKLDSSLFITEHREENIKLDGFPNLNIVEVTNTLNLYLI